MGPTRSQAAMFAAMRNRGVHRRLRVLSRRGVVNGRKVNRVLDRLCREGDARYRRLAEELSPTEASRVLESWFQRELLRFAKRAWRYRRGRVAARRPTMRAVAPTRRPATRIHRAGRTRRAIRRGAGTAGGVEEGSEGGPEPPPPGSSGRAPESPAVVDRAGRGAS